MNRITEAHIFVWRATPAIQCALRLFDSFNSENTKINYQLLNEKIFFLFCTQGQVTLYSDKTVISFIGTCHKGQAGPAFLQISE